MSLITSEREPSSHSIEGFCDLTGLKRSGVFNMIARGELEVAKVVRRTLIPHRSALEWLERAIVKLERAA